MGVFLLVPAPLAAGKVLIANLIRLFQATGNVAFGSLAAPLVDIALGSAPGREGVIPGRLKKPN